MARVNPLNRPSGSASLMALRVQEAVSADERAARAAARARGAARRTARVRARLAPGAAARASLLLRPLARAPRLLLLAYYETGQSARPHRLLRHVFHFEPVETVEISTTPRRGLSVKDDRVFENMHLAVEVKNICNEKEDDITVEILEASLLSRQWKLTDFITALDSESVLISRERAHLILKGARIFETLDEGRVEYSCLKIAKHLPESRVGVNKPPYSKFISDAVSSLLDVVEPIAQNTEKTTGLIRSMFVLRWKAFNKKTGRTAIGQHCLWLDCFTKTISHEREKINMDISNTIQLDETEIRPNLHERKEKNEKNNVIIFRLEHYNYIDHNFIVNKLCMIPVTINIVNCYGVPVSVFIDMSKQQNRESSGELGWTGALNNGLDPDSKELGLNVTLDKFESRRVQVCALCAAPGTYHVGSAFSVTSLCGGDNRASTHFPNSTSLLVVKHIV